MTQGAVLTSSCLGTALGHGLDQLFGEPPTPFHPVAWLGDGLNELENWTYHDDKLSGVVHLGIGMAGGILAGTALRVILGRTAATAITVGLANAGRMLGESASLVQTHLDNGDLGAARDELPTLAGRDPRQLGEDQIVRAVIESLAENTVDAVTATLFFGHLGGPAAVACHRVVNTLDAMVGHRSPCYSQFGWASARCDDALAYLPARLTLVSIALVRPRLARTIFDTARRDAGQHPSPNGGIVEAGFAAALGVGLGGTNTYGGVEEDRGHLGNGAAPERSDIARAVRLAHHVGLVFALTPLALIGMKRALHSHSFSFRVKS